METNNKLREALEATNKFLESAITDGKVTAQDITALRNIVSAARSEPVRNYEVGTAEEQAFRFAEFCDSWKVIDDMTECDKCNGDCPLIGVDGECKLAWAQMPYEEGDEKCEP